MTQYIRITVDVAVKSGPTEDPTQIIGDILQDAMELSGLDFFILEAEQTPMELVDAQWVETQLQTEGWTSEDDDDDDDIVSVWTDAEKQSPPSPSIHAQPPQPTVSTAINFAGIDPDSAQADDIRELHAEMTMPDGGPEEDDAT